MSVFDTSNTPLRRIVVKDPAVDALEGLNHNQGGDLGDIMRWQSRAKFYVDAYSSVADALAAANAAGAGTLVFQSPAYTISSTLTVTANNIHFQGDSWGNVLAGAAALAANPVVLVQNGAGALQIKGFTMENIKISIGSATGIGVKLVRCVEPMLLRVDIEGNNTTETALICDGTGGWGGGLHAYALRVASIKYGLSFTGVWTASDLTGCWIIGKGAPVIAGSVGISAGATAETTTLTGCEIEGWESGVSASGNGWRLVGCRFETVTTPVSQVASAEKLALIGNTYTVDCGANSYTELGRVTILDTASNWSMGEAAPVFNIRGGSTSATYGNRIYNSSISGAPLVELEISATGVTNAFGKVSAANEANLCLRPGGHVGSRDGTLILVHAANDVAKTQANGLEMLGAGSNIILASPDGTRYKLGIANGGGAVTIAPA